MAKTLRKRTARLLGRQADWEKTQSALSGTKRSREMRKPGSGKSRSSG